MRIWILFLAALWTGDVLAATNTASFLAQCQSMTLANPSGTDSSLGPVATSFTTYDGLAGLPLGINLGFVSGELRPRAGETGTYETDYYTAFSGVNAEYGFMLFGLPTNDADTNGLPDFLQVETTVNAAFSSPATYGKMDYPGNSSFAVSGQIRRDAGAMRGSYDLLVQAGGRTIIYDRAGWSLLRLSDEMLYSRETRNWLRLNLTLTNGNGVHASLTGTAIYTVPDANQLVLPQLTLNRNGSQYLVLAPMTLTRSGNRYQGNAIAADGYPATPWADYTRFVVEIVDTNDANTNGVPDLTDPTSAPDSTAPRVAFTTPAANARVTNAILTVRGTASDNIGIARVLYKYGYGTNDFVLATGTNNWSAQVPLEIGTNPVFVIAFDYRDNPSAFVTRNFIRVPTSPLTLTTTAGGTVTPNLNGANLILGDRYTVTAKPAPRHLFAGWTGGVETNVARLTFLMQSNLMLQANFVTNPFLAVKGSYLGLFAETNQASPESSGAFAATVTDLGKFTSTLRIGGRSYPLSGQFDLAGKVSKQMKFQVTNQLTASLCLDLTNGANQITGEFATSNWTARLTANRPLIYTRPNPAPDAGRYTVRLAYGVNSSGPLASGVAAVLVNINGSMTLSGTLADGTRAVQTAPVARNGHWPLFLPLYAGKGSISGWLRFTNDAPDSLAGELNWFKPAAPRDKLYPGGFTNFVSAPGSLYSAAMMTNFLAMNTNACLVVTGLATESLTNCLSLVAKNTFGGPGVKALKLDLLTGLWTGNYTNPATGKPLPLKTTLLLQRGYGFGHVLSTNLSAEVEFNPSP